MARSKGIKNITLGEWDEMKREYLTQNKSIREIAKERGYSHETIVRRSVEEKWVDERSKYWASINQELTTFISQEMVEAKKNMLKTGVYLFGKGVQVYQKYIDKIDNAKPDKDGNKPEFNMAEARTMMHDGIKILTLFMEEQNLLELFAGQAGDSTVLSFLKGEFAIIHGHKKAQPTEE